MSALWLWLSWTMVVALGLIAARGGVRPSGAIAAGDGLARMCRSRMPASPSSVVPLTRSPGVDTALDPDETPIRPRFTRGGGPIGLREDGLR